MIAIVKRILEEPDWKERNGMHWWEVKVEIEVDGILSNYTMEMDTGDSARSVTIGYEFEIKNRS